jgi:hypothetical protein
MENRLDLHLLLITFFLIIAIVIQWEGAGATFSYAPRQGRPGPQPQTTTPLPERSDSLEKRVLIMESGNKRLWYFKGNSFYQCKCTFMKE